MRVEVSQKARDDLQVIYNYLYDCFGARVAEVKLQGIRKDIDMLGENPFMGRAFVNNLRLLNSGLSIIVYEVDDRVLEVLHVVDGRSDYARTLFSK